MTERNRSRLSVGCAFFTLVLFLQLLNHQTNGQRDEAYFRGQGSAISVIVSTHNDARIITSVLESVEESVETFIQDRNHRNESIVSVQIIIVDDNSEDETALKIHRFLKHRKVQELQNFKKSPAGGQLSSYSKLYPVSSSFGVDAKYLVVELHTASKLGPGTAKNIGVEYSLGEMLFFLDARAFFLDDHISKCYYSLVKSTDAYAKTGVLSSSYRQSTRAAHSIIEGSSSPHGRSTGPSQQRQLQGGVEQEEKQMQPANICIWRKVHSFIEGFPEAGVFDELGPVASAYEAALGLGFPVASVPDVTVEPCLASSSSPSSSSTEKAKKIVREQLVDHHLDYLRKKLQAYKRGEALDTRDEFWAVQRVALQVVGHPFTEIHKLDTRQIRFSSTLGFAQRLFFQGKVEAAQAAFNITGEHVYDKKHTPVVGVLRTSSHESWPTAYPAQLHRDFIPFVRPSELSK